MALDIGLRLAQALNQIGIKMGSYIGKSSNVKKAMFGGKPTMFKPRALETVRGTGGNFDDALKLIEEEAQFIVNATDAEKMNFLNNVNDYKEFGGPPKRSGILTTDEAKNLTDEAKDLETSITDLKTTAQSMEDDATANLKSAEDDLATFFETGGNPLNKKDKKYLGGSMSEEGQVRTGIRQFLQKEYKNGRINLDKKDIERVMKYSGLSEDDPILVFKKLYGDEAYKKAGTFPGAFDIGENYNQYEEIFRKNMGEDILKVKDSKYSGDGTLMLTDEVKTPTPDDDVPFAEGGIADVRVGFVKGKAATKVKQLIEYIKKQFSPMDAMKEVNKVIGKQGKYKNLTQKDIDEIVEKTEDFIFQRDPDDLYVADKKRLLTDDEIEYYTDELGDTETWMMDGTVGEAEKALADNKEYMAAMKKEYDAASPAERAEVIGSKEPVEDRPMFKKDSSTQVFKDSKGGIKGITMGGDDEFKKVMSEAMEEGMRESENMKRFGLDPSKSVDFDKYEKMKELGQMEKNVTGLADMSESETLMKKYPGMDKKLADQIANDTDPNRKANVIAMVEQTFKLSEKGKSGDEIIEIFKKGTDRTEQADGGITRLRNGYYGGGQAMVGEDLSQIGHGADALMARNMQLAPNSMATTSTGLNYLLGEDNDTVRVPYKDGLEVKVPPSKPYTTEMFEDDSMTLLQGMYGTGKDSNEFLYNEIIKKGNKLREKGVDRETVIEIIKNNKDKIDMILKQQTGDKKSLAGLADGGRIGYDQGGSSQPMGPEFSTNDPKAALKEIIKRFIPVKNYSIPLIGDSQLMFNSLDNVQAGGQSDLFGGELNYGLKKSLTDDKFGLGFEFKKSFADGGRIGFAEGGIKDTKIIKGQPHLLTYITPNEVEKLKALGGQETMTPEGIPAYPEYDNYGFSSQKDFDSGDLSKSNDPAVRGEAPGQNRITAQQLAATNAAEKKAAEAPKPFTFKNIYNTGSEINYLKNLYERNPIGLGISYGINKFGPSVMEKLKNLRSQTDLEDEYDFSGIKNQLAEAINFDKLGIAKDPFTPKSTMITGSVVDSFMKENPNATKGDFVNALQSGSLGVGGSQLFDKNVDSLFEGVNLGKSMSPFDVSPTFKGTTDGTFKGNIDIDKGALEQDALDALPKEFFVGAKGGLAKFADGGIAGLRKGYVGGGGVNLARRGFLKLAGATVASVAALKTGLVKILGKTAAKSVPKMVTIPPGSGAPAWFEGMVNKVLADGIDITKTASTLDGQVVKSLDTPTGKVDVTFDTRTGSIDAFYKGENTAMGESVDMRYTVDQADEGTKGLKPADEFEAVETIPEMQGFARDGDYDLAFGENSVSNVKGLYSDTSELAELGGQKILIKDISESIKKKKVLKDMKEDSLGFASEGNAGVYYDD